MTPKREEKDRREAYWRESETNNPGRYTISSPIFLSDAWILPLRECIEKSSIHNSDRRPNGKDNHVAHDINPAASFVVAQRSELMSREYAELLMNALRE